MGSQIAHKLWTLAGRSENFCTILARLPSFGMEILLNVTAFDGSFTRPIFAGSKYRWGATKLLDQVAGGSQR